MFSQAELEEAALIKELVELRDKVERMKVVAAANVQERAADKAKIRELEEKVRKMTLVIRALQAKLGGVQPAA